MPKISLQLERNLYDADTALSNVLKHTNELGHAEFHELSNVKAEFDIIRSGLERKK